MEFDCFACSLCIIHRHHPPTNTAGAMLRAAGRFVVVLFCVFSVFCIVVRGGVGDSKHREGVGTVMCFKQVVPIFGGLAAFSHGFVTLSRCCWPVTEWECLGYRGRVVAQALKNAEYISMDIV
jgi:hypothetical protein